MADSLPPESLGNYVSIGFDGTRYTLQSNSGTARLATGAHTDAEHSAIIARLRQDYATLRQWSQDAATTNTNWPTMTQTQKDNATRETIRRLGILLDRVGDVLVALNADV